MSLLRIDISNETISVVSVFAPLSLLGETDAVCLQLPALSYGSARLVAVIDSVISYQLASNNEIAREPPTITSWTNQVPPLAEWAH